MKKIISNKNGRSTLENYICNFIKENYNGAIMRTTKNTIKGKELDLYIKELSLAIEINGTYWHSDYKIEKDYHFIKSKKCLESNIHLIHINEWDWFFMNEKTKHLILSFIQEKITYKDEDVYCKKINKSEYDTFLKNKYEKTTAEFFYGIYMKNKLVCCLALMSNNNFYTINQIKLLSNININIIKYILKTLDKDVHYLLNFSEENIYNFLQMGFKEIEYIKPTYNFYGYKKRVLYNELKSFNDEDIESKLKNEGFLKVWNSGYYKLIYKKEDI